MRLSVIIPTFNREQILKLTLERLFAQVGEADMEIVVADDGSSVATQDVIQAACARAPFPVRLIAQSNRGPAAARNLAIREASGDLLLFLGDDIFASPDLVATHLRVHAQHPSESVAVLGYTSPAPEMRKTALSEYIERSGLQFAYQHIQDPNNVSYEHFYTSNVSLKRAFLLRFGMFDEEFPYAAYEDLELAYRLQSQHGLQIIFEPGARAYHFHPVSIRQLEQRGFFKGRSVVILNRKHPEVFDVDSVVRLFPRHKVWIKRALFVFLVPFASFVERRGWMMRLDRVFAWIETWNFFQGICVERRGAARVG